MSKILSAQECNEKLQAYYQEHYGERDTDVWYEKPAVNVCVFGRDGKYISLQCHILNGEITEYIETM